MTGLPIQNNTLAAAKTESQDSFKRKIARAKGEQLNTVAAAPDQTTEAVKPVTLQIQSREAAKSPRANGLVLAESLPKSLAHASAPCGNTTTDIISASNSLQSTSRVTGDQRLCEPISQKPTQVNVSMSTPPDTPQFVTSAKRKRLESEACDVVITKTVTKVPKTPPPPTYEEIMQENERLKEENHQLRLAHSRISSVDKVMTKFVTSASIMETAVDVREKEMRKGLNAIAEAMTTVQGQLAEMVEFSNGTTEVVGKISQSANENHELHLSKAEAGRLQLRYENARPKQEVGEAIYERLPFTPKARGRPKSFI